MSTTQLPHEELAASILEPHQYPTFDDRAVEEALRRTIIEEEDEETEDENGKNNDISSLDKRNKIFHNSSNSLSLRRFGWQKWWPSSHYWSKVDGWRWSWSSCG